MRRIRGKKEERSNLNKSIIILFCRTQYQIDLENDFEKLSLVLRGVLNEIKVG